MGLADHPVTLVRAVTVLSVSFHNFPLRTDYKCQQKSYYYICAERRHLISKPEVDCRPGMTCHLADNSCKRHLLK